MKKKPKQLDLESKEMRKLMKINAAILEIEKMFGKGKIKLGSSSKNERV